jgi:hypothetical protein
VCRQIFLVILGGSLILRHHSVDIGLCDGHGELDVCVFQTAPHTVSASCDDVTRETNRENSPSESFHDFMIFRIRLFWRLSRRAKLQKTNTKVQVNRTLMDDDEYEGRFDERDEDEMADEDVEDAEQDVMVEPAFAKEGYLSKQGNFNSQWQRRWFCFRDHMLKYYKTMGVRR